MDRHLDSSPRELSSHSGFLIAPKINVQRAVPRRLEVDVCYKCDPELDRKSVV